jgi:hypothetical protein
MCCAVLTIAGLGIACIAGRSRGYPLYSTANGRPDKDQVALLTGYVRTVDAEDVSAFQRPLELLPGCHIIRTPTRWLDAQGRGAVTWMTGEWTFALPMKAGYRYSIEIIGQAVVTGPTVPLEMKAFERDMHGTKTDTFERARSMDDLRECRELAGEPTTPPGRVERAPEKGEAAPGNPEPTPDNGPDE